MGAMKRWLEDLATRLNMEMDDPRLRTIAEQEWEKVAGPKWYVYRYQYREMKEPEWDASSVSEGIDALPPTVLSYPGIQVVNAHSKEEAISQVKRQVHLPSNKRFVLLVSPIGEMTCLPAGDPRIVDIYRRWTPVITVNRPLMSRLVHYVQLWAGGPTTCEEERMFCVEIYGNGYMITLKHAGMRSKKTKVNTLNEVELSLRHYFKGHPDFVHRCPFCLRRG